MANVPSAINYIQIEGTTLRAPVSESLIQTMSGSINALLDANASSFVQFLIGGVYTVPLGKSRLYVLACAGGGGGQGGWNAAPGNGFVAQGGGGGGGSGIFEGFVVVQPTEILTITIGAGGLGTANTGPGIPAAGGNGTTTSITGSLSGAILDIQAGTGGGFFGMGYGGPSSGGKHGGGGTFAVPGNTYLVGNVGTYYDPATTTFYLAGYGGNRTGATSGMGGGSIGTGGNKPGGAGTTANGGYGAGGTGLDGGFNNVGGDGGPGLLRIYAI